MKQTALNIIVIILGFLTIFGLSRFLEAHQTPLPPEIVEADLAFNVKTLKKYSFGFDGLIADYYWMSALQYIGHKIIDNGGMNSININNLKPLNPRLLYPMLDSAITLDPDFSIVYNYGSVIMPAIDLEKAIEISEKGITAQPDNWKMYHNLGFIYWQQNDFKKAAEIYGAGATKPNAPLWVGQLSATLLAEGGGNRETARQIYRRSYETAEDKYSKEMFIRRLLQVDALDELDVIRPTLSEFQSKNNRCAENWREMFPLLRSVKLADNRGLRFSTALEPLDPSGAVYHLDNQKDRCTASVNSKISKIPPEQSIK